MNEINGADTETHMGYCRLICIENWLDFYTTKTDDWKELLNYLLDAPARLAYWNLRFDVEAILKHFPDDFIQNLLYLTESEIELDGKIYAFKLIPWKVFTIKEMKMEGKRRRTVRKSEAFDAAQFYQCSLQEASKQVLGETKKEDPKFAESLNTSEELWNTQLTRIKNYCYDDAVKAGKLIRKFQEATAADPIKLSPKNPISCAWYSKELIKQVIPEVKKIKSVTTNQGYYYNRPWKRYDNLASQCYFGGRFEVFSKGTVEDAYIYDINSAYPYWISRLPNPYNLMFVKDYEPEGEFSMVKAEVWVPEDLTIGPLPYRTPTTIIFPTGNWVGWFHHHELKNAERFGVDYQIMKALNGYEPNGKQRPFKDKIDHFYTQRLQWKEENDPRQLPAKIAMNSVYGVFFEKNERIIESDQPHATEIDGHLLSKHKDNPGRFFHPFFAGYITSKTRVQILNAIPVKEPEIAKFFATDGALTNKKLNNLPISKKLGEWSEKKVETARIFSNGLYELDGKTKTRGFRKDHARDRRPLKDRMRVTKDGIVIEVEERGPIHLNMSFKLRDYSKKDALTWIEKKKEMNITDCKKRNWPNFTIDDLYATEIPSTPKNIDHRKLNRNPGLVWTGDSGNVPNLANRFILGKMEMASNG